MTKEQMVFTLDKEIEFAKQCGMPQFVAGLLQAKKVLENQWDNVNEGER